jgi:hypothetical protein
MTPEEFERKMEDLKSPSAENVKPPVEIKLAIVNAQQSANIGLWFVAVPYVFIILMVLKYELDVNLGIVDAFSRAVGKIDGNPWLWWLQPFFLIILPATGIVLNILSITHFVHDRNNSTLTMTIKFRWLNIVVLVLSLFVVGLLALYLIVENFLPSHH